MPFRAQNQDFNLILIANCPALGLSAVIFTIMHQKLAVLPKLYITIRDEIGTDRSGLKKPAKIAAELIKSIKNQDLN